MNDQWPEVINRYGKASVPNLYLIIVIKILNMKKVMNLLLCGAVVCGFTSCGNQTKKAEALMDSAKNSVESMAGAVDSVAQKGLAELMKESEGKYAQEIGLLDNPLLKGRLEALTKDLAPEIIKNFNTQTPVVSEDGIFKFSGGKAHEVPAFNTTIYYDSNSDNMRVDVERNGKVQTFVEKGDLKVSDALKQK